MASVIITGRTERAQMTLPEHWSAEDIRDEIELLAVLKAKEGVFAPNLVVTLNPYSGSMAEFLASAVGNLAQTLTDVQFIDVTLWNRDRELPEDAAAEGRAITYTHVSPSSGDILRTTEWLFIEGGLAVQATGTTAAQDWMFLAPELEQIASSLALAESVMAPTPVDRTLPDGALDALASSELGYPVESISGLGRQQHYDYAGEWVRGASFALVDEMAEGFKVGRLQADDYRAELDDLARAGLVEGTKLTEAGEFIQLHLQDPDASFRISGAGAGGESHYQAWAYGPSVLVAAGPGCHAQTGLQDAGAPSLDHVNVQILPLSALARDMAAWAGVGPAWALPALPAGLSQEQFAQRWAGNTEPPAGANAVLKALWEQNWFTWEFAAHGVESAVEPYAYLHGGPLGLYRVGSEDATTWVVPTPSVYVYDQLDDAIAAILYDRPVRLT